MDIQTAMDEFCTSLYARGRAVRTVDEYRKRLKPFCALGRLEDLRPAHLEALLAGMRGRGLAAASLASTVQTAKTFLSWCVGRGYLAASPAAGLARPRLEQSRRGKAVPQAVLDAAIEQARREENARGLAVLLFLVDTGCRVGELLSIRRVDLDLDRMEALCRGKTGERVLDFTEPTAAALRTYLLLIRGEKVFDLTVWGVYKLLWGLTRRAGVARFGPHAVRHRVGQGWIDAGANLELVRIKLGHRDIGTTSRFYAHQDREREKRASRKYSLVK